MDFGFLGRVGALAVYFERSASEQTGSTQSLRMSQSSRMPLMAW